MAIHKYKWLVSTKPLTFPQDTIIIFIVVFLNLLILLFICNVAWQAFLWCRQLLCQTLARWALQLHFWVTQLDPAQRWIWFAAQCTWLHTRRATLRCRAWQTATNQHNYQCPTHLNENLTIEIQRFWFKFNIIKKIKYQILCKNSFTIQLQRCHVQPIKLLFSFFKKIVNT